MTYRVVVGFFLKLELISCKVSENNISVGPSKEEHTLEAEIVFSKLTPTIFTFLNEKILLSFT